MSLSLQFSVYNIILYTLTECFFHLQVTAVCEGRVRNGFGLVRPPGHHATKSDLCGFSLCNSVAIAARHALSNLNVAKVLIVDFDVHHGQGSVQQSQVSSKFALHCFNLPRLMDTPKNLPIISICISILFCGVQIRFQIWIDSLQSSFDPQFEFQCAN